MKLSRNQIHIWKANLKRHSSDLDYLYHKVLSPDERDRADALRSEGDQKRSIISRGLLRKKLGSYLESDPAHLSFSYNKYGKPYLDANSHKGDLKFNVSHSKDMVVYAVTLNREIGIDVEYLKEVNKADKIVDRFFSEAEMKFYNSQSEDRKKWAFFTLWTRKEAYSKAMGRGIGLPATDFDLDLTLDCDQHKPVSWGKSKWTLYSIEIDTGYLAALATEGDNVDICHCNPQSS